jgi:pSer/pThr/pTyr-binding forkhead associated (FHA) protein
MPVFLTVVSEANRGRQISIAIPEFKIGRDPNCHLRPTSGDISRLHCAIVRKHGRVFLRDYGSSNGTLLNHRLLVHGELQLEDGDLIEVGPLAFRISLPADVRSEANIHEDENFERAVLGDIEPSLDKTVVISRPDLPDMAVQGPDDAGLAISLD